jgi:general secretion pathway protein D
MPTLKGQTSEAAAASALAQMRQQNAADIPSVGPASPPAAPASSVEAASFVLTPPSVNPSAGVSFPLSVTLSGAHDVSSVPLQIQYDASKLTLLNVDSGDLLGKDGQAVALVHRDDGPGMITIAASRPPGAVGVNGAGAVCVLTFQAKTSGATDVVITHPGVLDSAQKSEPASAQPLHLVVK